MENILYVGGFVLPDRNAAAQRVIAIAKGFRDLGHRVVFLNYSDQVKESHWAVYSGFDCYNMPKRGMYQHLTSIEDAVSIIEEKQITAVVAYNYPAVAMRKLISWCRKHGVKCYADVTEWYVAQGNLIFRVIKTLDTEWRMRLLHPKMDGVIAISDYLYNYYKDKVPTVKIPPTVDVQDEKWNVQPAERDMDKTVFVYAGNTSAQKERLDLILDAASSLQDRCAMELRIIGITREQYETIYGRKAPEGYAEFLGRISHTEVIREVTSADWSIIIRDNNKVVQAGFPTKVVESITCGTPVIANGFSNITNYLDEHNSILCSQDSIAAAMEKACENREMAVERDLFDYHKYSDELSLLLKNI